MRILSIFAVLIMSACCELAEYQCHKDCAPTMAVSDASPVQFWPIDCNTWNQQTPSGVHHYCFCQHFQCADEIKIPFSSSETIQFEQLVSSFDGDLDGWVNGAGASKPSWAFSGDFGGSAKVTSIATFGPKTISLTPPRVPPGVQFYIKIKYAIDDSGTSPFPYLRLTIRNASNTLRFDSGNFLGSTSGSETTQTVFVSIPITDASKIEITPGSTGDVWGAGDIFWVSEISYLYTIDEEYVLTARDEDDEELMSVPFTGSGGSLNASFTPEDYDICDQKITLEISNTLQIPELFAWYNSDVGDASWLGVGTNNPFILIPIGNSYTDELKTTLSLTSLPADGYSFYYDFSINIPVESNDLFFIVGLRQGNFIVGSNDFQPLAAGETHFHGTVNILASGIPDNMYIQFFRNAGSNDYIAAFSSFDISSEADKLYKSDCIDIKELHAESLLIDYSNHSNYAGIEYGEITPDPSYSIRIPAVFFQTRFPQEGEDAELSNSQIIALNSLVKEQRLLSTGRMPIYMHRKMVLVLNHQFIYIDGQYWEKGTEAYELKEKSNKRDSFDMYTCWLTRQNFVARNIL